MTFICSSSSSVTLCVCLAALLSQVAGQSSFSFPGVSHPRGSRQGGQLSSGNVLSFPGGETLAGNGLSFPGKETLAGNGLSFPRGAKLAGNDLSFPGEETLAKMV